MVPKRGGSPFFVRKFFVFLSVNFITKQKNILAYNPRQIKYYENLNIEWTCVSEVHVTSLVNYKNYIDFEVRF